jgi:hypothetical protein
MRKILAIAFAAPLFTACTVGEDPTMSGDDGTEHPTPDPDPNPSGTGLEGTIQSDTTWTGTQRVKAKVTIPAGVTVTMDAGATLEFANSASIEVAGTLKLVGTSASKVYMKSEAGAAYWGPIAVTGTLDMKYADFTGGAIRTDAATASLLIVDSKMYKAGGDYIVMNGGTINMTYSQVGANPGETDGTHCNLHINAATSITATNNNINGAPYGIMFYGGTGANFQNNNWYDAGTAPTGADVATSTGVSGDFSGSWFKAGLPCQNNTCPGAQITVNNPAGAKLVDAGPRP